MIEKITGGVLDADVTSGESHASALVFETVCEDNKYNGALIPTSSGAREYVGRLPQDREIEVLFEIHAKGRSRPLQFNGTGKIGNFQELHEHTFLVLSTTGGTFLLLFDKQSTTDLEKKSVGRESLKDQRCQIGFEF